MGLRLAFIGSIREEILNIGDLSIELIKFLLEYYPSSLKERYSLASGVNDPVQVLEQIATIRSCKIKGGELDLNKAASILIDDFRDGRLGNITLEFPEKESEVPSSEVEK